MYIPLLDIIIIYDCKPVYQVNFCTLILTLVLLTIAKAWNKFSYYIQMSK